jgi:nitrogen regulatory protein P-II 1
MKMIIALIQPHRLEAVKRELSKHDISRLTVLDASGYGRQQGQTQFFRGHELDSTLINKIEIQVAVNDEFVRPAVDGIMAGARGEEGGQTGDGKIFVLPMEECIRISDGAEGVDAI